MPNLHTRCQQPTQLLRPVSKLTFQDWLIAHANMALAQRLQKLANRLGISPEQVFMLMSKKEKTPLENGREIARAVFGESSAWERKADESSLSALGMTYTLTRFSKNDGTAASQALTMVWQYAEAWLREKLTQLSGAELRLLGELLVHAGNTYDTAYALARDRAWITKKHRGGGQLLTSLAGKILGPSSSEQTQLVQRFSLYKALPQEVLRQYPLNATTQARVQNALDTGLSQSEINNAKQHLRTLLENGEIFGGDAAWLDHPHRAPQDFVDLAQTYANKKTGLSNEGREAFRALNDLWQHANAELRDKLVQLSGAELRLLGEFLANSDLFGALAQKMLGVVGLEQTPKVRIYSLYRALPKEVTDLYPLSEKTQQEVQNALNNRSVKNFLQADIDDAEGLLRKLIERREIFGGDAAWLDHPHRAPQDFVDLAQTYVNRKTGLFNEGREAFRALNDLWQHANAELRDKLVQLSGAELRLLGEFLANRADFDLIAAAFGKAETWLTSKSGTGSDYFGALAQKMLGVFGLEQTRKVRIYSLYRALPKEVTDLYPLSEKTQQEVQNALNNRSGKNFLQTDIDDAEGWLRKLIERREIFDGNDGWFKHAPRVPADFVELTQSYQDNDGQKAFRALNVLWQYADAEFHDKLNQLTGAELRLLGEFLVHQGSPTPTAAAFAKPLGWITAKSGAGAKLVSSLAEKVDPSFRPNATLEAQIASLFKALPEGVTAQYPLGKRNPKEAQKKKAPDTFPSSPLTAPTPLPDTPVSNSPRLETVVTPGQDVEQVPKVATVQQLEKLLGESGSQRALVEKSLVIARLLDPNAGETGGGGRLPGLHTDVWLTPAEAVILQAYRSTYDPENNNFSSAKFNNAKKEDLVKFLREKGLLNSTKPLADIFLETAKNAIDKIYASLDPEQRFRNTRSTRVMQYLSQQIPESSPPAVNPAREHAQAVFQSLVEDDILSPEMAAQFMSSLFGPEPTQGIGRTRASTKRWDLRKTDIRHLPVKVPSAEDRRRFQEERGQAFLGILQRFGDTGLGAGKTPSQDAEFAYRVSIGLRALRDSYPTLVAELLTQAQSPDSVPNVDALRQRFFPDVDPSSTSPIGQATMSAFLDEVRLAATFVTRPTVKKIWGTSPLTPAQATAGLRLDEKISKALSSGERQSYLISLAQANDNRRAAFAALASNAALEENPSTVVIWTSSTYLAESVVPREARAALGDTYDIVTSTEDLAQRMSDPSRTKPLLAILSDDALTADVGGLQRIQQDLQNHPGLPLIYIADEAQRFADPNSNRRTALSPLVDRAQTTIGLSAEPVSTKVSNLYNLGTFLGVPNLNEAHRENAVLMYAAMSPYFMAANSQRPKPNTSYPDVTYSDDGLQSSQAIQADDTPAGSWKYHQENYVGIQEKLPLITSRVAQRLAKGGKVVIGTQYINQGVVPLQEALNKNGETQRAHVESINGNMFPQDRREMLRRFALPTGSPDAIDVLITTFDAVSGDSAVDLTQPPRGGYEVIAANVPSTPREMKSLIGLVDREEWPSNVEVNVTIPIMKFPKGTATKGLMTKDQDHLTTLLARTDQSNRALGGDQETEAYTPTPMQLERYRLGIYYRGYQNAADTEAVKRLMKANEAPAAWQQSVGFLRGQTKGFAKQFASKHERPPTLVDFGSGYNYLTMEMLRSKLVSEAVGIDLIPKEMMTALVQDGTLVEGSDTHHIEGNIEDAPQLLRDHHGADFKADIVTASFSLLADKPELMARYFRAASEVLRPGGRLMVIHPLGSFDPARQDDLKKGWEQMGFKKVADTELVTLGGAVRYFALEKVGPTQRNVEPKLFRFK